MLRAAPTTASAASGVLFVERHRVNEVARHETRRSAAAAAAPPASGSSTSGFSGVIGLILAPLLVHALLVDPTFLALLDCFAAHLLLAPAAEVEHGRHVEA